MRLVLFFVFVLALCGCQHGQGVVGHGLRSDDWMSQQIVGEWIGGGGIMPIKNVFYEDGRYENFVPLEPGKCEKTVGTWRIEAGQLVWVIDGKEAAVEILKFNDDRFQIKTSSGGTHGYY